MDFWKVPGELNEADLGLPADDEKKQLKEIKEKQQSTPQSPSKLTVWPPVSPDALGKSELPLPGEGRGGRGARRKGKGDKDAAGDKKPGGDAKAAGGGGAGGADAKKREDGWLPKAEYEAKKREERAKRQREREQERTSQATPSTGGKGGGAKGGGGGGGDQGGRGGRDQGRQGGRDNWQDVIPKRPEPVEETAEMREAAEAEDRKLACRDQLRGATTAAELRAAIDAARELGLTQEVSMGERKLSKMEA